MRITSKLTEGFSFTSDIRGHQLTVDITKEMGGEDTGPMPPELVATALGTCVGIFAVMFCRKHDIPTEGLTVHTDWEKGGDPVRITQMAVAVELPAGVPDKQHTAFMRTIEQCMVHHTFCEIPKIEMKLV